MMMKLTPLFMLLLLMTSCTTTTAQDAQNITDFDPTENEKAILIDVRTPKEFAQGHLHTARNIDVSDERFKSKFAQFNKKDVIYLYCRSGSRSAKAQKIAQDLGFTHVINLEGGILAWKAAKKPIEE